MSADLSGEPRADAPRVIGIDWSGAATGAAKRIWLAEVSRGQVVRLECGRSREAIARHLVAEARRTPQTVVGLDFAFSFPAWFLRENGLDSAVALWGRVARDGEAWLASCEPPFWGRPGRGCPLGPEQQFRHTDREAPRINGVGPKSVFQIGGAGAVGTGSIRGMPILAELRAAGFAIWPFDRAELPLAVEIYPRVLTGPVIKTDIQARRSYLDCHFPECDTVAASMAAASEDAFDALVSALVMDRHVDDLVRLPVVTDPDVGLEGRIWIPQDGTGSAPSLFHRSARIA